jgi:hypothetical protein
MPRVHPNHIFFIVDARAPACRKVGFETLSSEIYKHYAAPIDRALKTYIKSIVAPLLQNSKERLSQMEGCSADLTRNMMFGIAANSDPAFYTIFTGSV